MPERPTGCKIHEKYNRFKEAMEFMEIVWPVLVRQNGPSK